MVRNTKEVRMTTTFAYPEAPAEHGRGGRVEGELKVSGQLMYADDLALPGLLYVAAVRSPYPHARIVSINTARGRRIRTHARGIRRRGSSQTGGAGRS